MNNSTPITHFYVTVGIITLLYAGRFPSVFEYIKAENKFSNEQLKYQILGVNNSYDIKINLLGTRLMTFCEQKIFRGN